MPKRKKAAPLEEINFPERYLVVGADLSLTRPGFALFNIEQKDGATVVKLEKLLSVNNKGNKKKTHGEILDEIIQCFWNDLLPEDITVPLYLVREHEILKMKVPSERSVTKTVGLLDWAAYMLRNVIVDKTLFDGTWREIYPMTVKSLVAGSGKAEKQAVAEALPYFVGNVEYKNDDESDAVAVGLAWLIQHGQLKAKE